MVLRMLNRENLIKKDLVKDMFGDLVYSKSIWNRDLKLLMYDKHV